MSDDAPSHTRGDPVVSTQAPHAMSACNKEALCKPTCVVPTA